MAINPVPATASIFIGLRRTAGYTPDGDAVRRAERSSRFLHVLCKRTDERAASIDQCRWPAVFEAWCTCS
jgi:hypothetical protein